MKVQYRTIFFGIVVSIGRTVSIGSSCSKNRVQMNLWQTDFQGPFRKRKGTSNAAIQLMSTKSGNVVRNLEEFNVLHLKSIHKGEHKTC